MSSEKSIILVTGGNSGIGFEAAKQLLVSPLKHVIIACRSASKGQPAVQDLQSLGLPGSVEMLELDVNKEDSINAAAKRVESEHGRLDVLVNNAGVASFPAEVPLAEQMSAIYTTNVIGPELMGRAFLPLLKKSSSTARIVNVSSGLGSMAMRSNPDYVAIEAIEYRASKAALSMVTVNQAVVFGPQGIKVFAVCPGFTVSNLGPYNNEASGAQPVSEGAKPIVKVVNGERDAEHGKFVARESAVYDW